MNKIKYIRVQNVGIIEGNIKEFQVNGEMAKVNWYAVEEDKFPFDNKPVTREFNGKYVIEICRFKEQ